MMEVDNNEEPVLTEDMFNNTLKRLSSKHANKYSFILKGGLSFRKFLFFLCRTVWKSEKIPSMWNKIETIQLYKGNGNFNDLSNYRNIHTKCGSRKVFGEIVTHEIKLKAIDNISKFQIGALPNHITELQLSQLNL